MFSVFLCDKSIGLGVLSRTTDRSLMGMDDISRTQALDHVLDPVSNALQVCVDLSQRAWRLEYIEMPVEGYLVAHLGLFVVYPGIWRMG
jgi:hypothetical protein